VLGGGLNVVTTLNPTLQALAEKAIVDNVRINGYRGFSQGALVSLDPHTGAVVAMVGAADTSQNGGQYNMALQARNPGSSFKIFTYTAAIESGKFSMSTPIVDSPITIDQPGQAPWKPLNYDKTYRGTCQLQQCMGNSLNVPAVKVELGVGVPNVVAVARKMGAAPFYPTGPGTYSQEVSADSFGPSLTLGGYGENVLQMATAASVLGAQGVLRPPFSIQSITSSDATPIFAADPAKDAKWVLDPKVAYIMETIMSNDNNRAMIFGRGTPLTLTPRIAGAKTGTTDNFTDGWTVGYTPALATAVWVGNPNNSPMAQGADGVFVAAPAWHAYMMTALDAMGRPANEWFAEPPGLGHSGGVLLLPGTSAGMAPPALPSYAHTSTPSPSPSPKPGG
jgi:membrane peptidoglycan carboxypeptidase